jgi:two-component system sensor histidine kinase RegB
MLSRRQTWIVLALAASCYTTLLFHYVPLTSVADDHELTMRMHTFGMWLTYLLSSGLIAYFVSRGRDRERLLAEAREAMLRDERVLAIGTMAAGAAHELGTPLTTIGVLAKELQDQYSDHATLVEDLTVLRRQVDACKTSVTHLLAAARKSQFEGATSLPVTEFVANVIAKWQLMRPVVHFENRVAGNPPVPAVVTDVTLGQAMMNLLNNAADASADNVEIRTGWNGEHITIEILDRGPGFPEAAMQSGGKAFFSTKEPDSGRGLGLFLARAAVERMGGSLQLTHREGGGAIARLELPTAGDKT